MKKSYIYIIFCLIFVFLPFYNPQKAFARETPTIRISTDQNYPVRVMDGTKPTNDWSVFGLLTGTESDDQITVWLTKTGNGVEKILPKTAKINKDTSGKAYSFYATFKDLESGTYAVHSNISYKISSTYFLQKTPEKYYSDTNKVIYTSKIFTITAIPIIRNGEITVKHLDNDNFRLTTTIDSYDSTKNYALYLKNKDTGEEKKSTATALQNSDKNTSKNLFAEFYNISGSFTAYVVYKEGINTISMAEFSFSTGEVIDKGEIVGNKKTVDNGNVVDPKIGDVTVDVPDNSNTFVLDITGSDIPENSLYEMVIFEKDGNQSSPTYIKPNTGSIKVSNVGGFLDMKVTYTFDQIPKSGQYYVLTKIKKPDTAKTVLDQRQSEVSLNKEEKFAAIQSSNIYNITNTTIPETGGEYKLLVPLPGIGDTFDYSAPGAFQNLINIILKLIFGAITVYAVLLTIYWGIRYMVSDKEFTKSESKTKILNAIIAIVLALSSYLILNTINPDLVNISVNGEKVNITTRAIEFIDNGKLEQIIGKNTLSKERYKEESKTVSSQLGIPYCALQVILERESGGNPGAIGFDENTASNDIPSRRAFVNSGKKYDGTTFTSSNDLITKKDFWNQHKADVKNEPGLGLDWRFSKGLGLTQITLFPDTYSGSASYTKNPPGLDKKNKYPTLAVKYTKNGQSVTEQLTPKDLLDPEKNLLAGGQVWKSSWTKCNKDIYGAWVGYGSGPGTCTAGNEFIKAQAKARTELYNGCVAAKLGQ